MPIRTVAGMLAVALLALLAACKTSYTTMDQVPPSERANAQVLNDYQNCASDAYLRLLREGAGRFDRAAFDARLEAMAVQACDSCSAELAAYEAFLAGRTDMAELPPQAAAQLRQDTAQWLAEWARESFARAEAQTP